MENELKQLKDTYEKEKSKMDTQLEQASIHTKALQMISCKDLVFNHREAIPDFRNDSAVMYRQFENFSNSIRGIPSEDHRKGEGMYQEMKQVYEELLEKCDKYSKIILKLKADMYKITSEYDKNIKVLIDTIEKSKNEPVSKELAKKFNKKILNYKLKIRNLEESLEKSQADYQSILQENEKLKVCNSETSNFKQKIAYLK